MMHIDDIKEPGTLIELSGPDAKYIMTFESGMLNGDYSIFKSTLIATRRVWILPHELEELSVYLGCTADEVLGFVEDLSINIGRVEIKSEIFMYEFFLISSPEVSFYEACFSNENVYNNFYIKELFRNARIVSNGNEKR